MDEGQVEGFVAAAEHDFAAMVGVYRALVTQSSPFDVDEVRDARADVLAAQQVLLLARSEASGAGRRGVAEEDAPCPRCGRVVNRAFLFDSDARGVEWCAGWDVGGAQETGR